MTYPQLHLSVSYLRGDEDAQGRIVFHRRLMAFSPEFSNPAANGC
jgi:hypothetical protein